MNPSCHHLPVSLLIPLLLTVAPSLVPGFHDLPLPSHTVVISLTHVIAYRLSLAVVPSCLPWCHHIPLPSLIPSRYRMPLPSPTVVSSLAAAITYAVSITYRCHSLHRCHHIHTAVVAYFPSSAVAYYMHTQERRRFRTGSRSTLERDLSLRPQGETSWKGTFSTALPGFGTR